MGIIRKQSIFSSVFSYAGFAIGALNKLLIFPAFFSSKQIGLTTLLVDIGLVFSAVATLGSNSITYKFFPFYKEYLPKKKNDLPAFTLLLCLSGCIVVISAVFLFQNFISRKFGAQSPLFVSHYNLLYPLIISTALFSLFESYAWSIQKTVVSNFLREVAFRIFVLVLLLCYIYKVVSLETFFTLYSFIYVPSAVLLIFYLIRSGNFPINFSISNVTKRIHKRIIAFGSLIFSSSLLNVLSRAIDVIFLASQSTGGLSDANVFSYGSYMISIMEVPQRSITAIATPIIAQAWRDKDRKKIEDLYHKTSLNLLIVGLAIWGLIYLNMNSAIAYLGPEYAPMKTVFVIMGIAKLIDLGTGANSQILLLSKHWRLDFFTNSAYVMLSLPLNFFLVKKYHIYGPAWANLIAMTAFNTVRFLYIWKLFRMQPFTRTTLYALLLAVVCVAAVSFVPTIGNIYIDVIIRSILFAFVFALFILLLNVSPDITSLYRTTLLRLKRE